MVGQLYLKSKNPKEVSCSSIERLSSVNISSATEISAAIRQHKEGRRQGREKESIFLVFHDSALCNFAHVLSLTGTGY